MALNLRLSCFRPLFLSREPLTPKALSKPRRVCQAEVTSQHSQPRRDLSIKSTARTFRESQCLRVQHNGVRALRRPQQCRWHSSPAEAQHSKVYSFDEVKSIVERPSKGRILIGTPYPSLKFFEQVQPNLTPLPNCRRSRTFGVFSWLHPHCHQCPSQIATQCPAAV